MDQLYIRNVLKGNREDFRFLIRKYKDLAFSVALSVVKNEYEAEEVVQEAFIKAYEHLSSFRGDAVFKTWFYKILVNEAFKKVRQSKSAPSLLRDGMAGDIEDADAHFLGLDEEEKHLLVRDALSRMESRESLVLQLFYFEGEGIREIAGITGWSEGNVKVILHRARKHLLGIVGPLLKTEFNPIRR
ncbi:MAG: sigma-70 family RNA polymerase sigma factor [Marinilabiliales bacterium]|nr:sigma-70 family RNA polymerase sigma factor [Marinilabiliales bacterium]